MNKQFIFGKSAVSPVIGTILMVAVTVIMGAIVGGFVYQTARPKTAPTIASTLEDDERVVITGTTSASRISKLVFEGGKNIAKGELKVIVTYIDEAGTEQTVVLAGSSWDSTTAVAMSAGKITARWIDADASTDITPGDRLDFANAAAGTADNVTAGTDFNVKLVHTPTEATLSSHTIKVY